MHKRLFSKMTAMAVISGIFVFACVTVNIYFPAEKVETAAGEIVQDIRSEQETDETGGQKKDTTAPARDNRTSFARSIRLTFTFPAEARAQENATEISNATIRALKSKMKARYQELKPYFAQNALAEGDDGYLNVANTSGMNLKQQRELRALVEAENQDRRQLYNEVAAALKIDSANVSRVAEIFAGEWKKTAP